MRVLASYAFMRTPAARDGWVEMIRQLRGCGVKTILDSGAVSVHRAGMSIPLEEYAAFLREYGRHFDEYVMLDVLGDGPKTEENFRRMRDAGLKPMCVAQPAIRSEFVIEMLECNPRLGISGVARRDWRVWLPAYLERIRQLDAPEPLFHGLGLTSATWPLKVGCHTCDSSTWTMGKRFGKFSLWTAATGCRQIDFSKMNKLPFRQMPDEVKRLLVASGVKCDFFKKRAARWGEWSMLAAFTCLAWLEYDHFLESRGCYLYLAVGSPQEVGLIALTMMCRREVGIDWQRYTRDAPTMDAALKSKRWKWVYAYLARAIEHNNHINGLGRSASTT